MAINYSPRIITDGLVFCLDAANPKSYPGSGTTWFDISKGQRHTNRFVGITFETVNNGVLRFNGSDNPMEQTDFYNPSGSNPIFLGTSPSSANNWNGDCTYEIWARPLSLGGANTGHLVTDSNYNEGEIEIRTDRIRCQWAGTNEINYMVTPDTNKWYHIVMTHAREASVYRLRLIVDLVERGNVTNTISGSSSSYGPDNRLSIGHLFNGYISTLKIYDRVLNNQELQKNFDAMRGRFEVEIAGAPPPPPPEPGPPSEPEPPPLQPGPPSQEP